MSHHVQSGGGGGGGGGEGIYPLQARRLDPRGVGPGFVDIFFFLENLLSDLV